MRCLADTRDIEKDKAAAQKKKLQGTVLHYLFKVPIVKARYDYFKLPFIYRVASESLSSETRTQTGSGQYFEVLDKLLGVCKEHNSWPQDPIGGSI